MKNFKRTSVFILSLLMFTYVSCDDEPLEGQFVTTGGGGGGGTTTCAEATDNVSTATTAFFDVTPGDANYPTVCNDYLAALENFIAACGDSSGGAQAIIDSLDCGGMPDECPSAQAATDVAETAYNAEPTNTDLCNAFISALENEIIECGDPTGDLQNTIDSLDCV